MAAFMSIETPKITTMRQFAGKYRHNHRVSNVLNADEKREHLNKELIKLPEGENYSDAFRQKIRSLEYYQDHKIRSNAVLGFEVMLTYNQSDVTESFDKEKWEEENVKWLKETFGEENVIEAIEHNDETTPHIHAIVIPIVDGRLNCRELTGGSQKLAGMQESYAKRMSALGLKTRTKYSVAKHEDIKHFYTAINEAVVEKLPEPFRDGNGKTVESVEDYFKRANHFLVTRNLQNLNEKKKLEHEILQAKSDNRRGRIEYSEALSELEELRREMDESVEANKKKVSLIDCILDGLNHNPDSELTRATKENISVLIKEEEDRRARQKQVQEKRETDLQER